MYSPEIYTRSLEVRWFWPGSGSRPEVAWFTRPITGAPGIEAENGREDAYLLLPDCETVGVKQREGKLEVKALVTPPMPMTWNAQQASGLADGWVKWSFTPAGERFPAELAAQGTWRTFKKRRWVRRYALATAEEVIPHPPGSEPGSGCTLEIVQLDGELTPGNRAQWVSFAAEAYGPSTTLQPLLSATVAAFLTAAGEPAAGLRTDHSWSYPRWLLHLARRS